MSGPGEALLLVRKAQGLTQDDVRNQLGITQVALSRYENDQRMPDGETLAKFAQIYGVTVGFLRFGQRMHGALVIDSHMRRQKPRKPRSGGSMVLRKGNIRSSGRSGGTPRRCDRRNAGVAPAVTDETPVTIHRVHGSTEISVIDTPPTGTRRVRYRKNISSHPVGP
jgi:transcriptional regulator with XRE-family HTH domain